MNFETTTPELKIYLDKIYNELQKRGENIAIAYTKPTETENKSEFIAHFFCTKCFQTKFTEVVADYAEKTLKEEVNNGN